jgi:hypothetical protein
MNMQPRAQSHGNLLSTPRVACPAAGRSVLLFITTFAAAAWLQGCHAPDDSSSRSDAGQDSGSEGIADPDVGRPDRPDANDADADVWEGSGPPPGHCCSASSAGYVDCGPFGTGPSLDACPPGYQCLGELNPYCYARQPGTCVAIPETCPDVGPESAVVAECTDMLGDLPLTYASECHARQAGYIWILRPASEM